MTPEEARSFVANGAALLDVRRPGWATLIDSGALDMACDCNCILGQLEGSYNAAVRHVWPWRFSRGRVALANAHGFHIGADHGQLSAYDMYEYLLLQDAWVEAIADRLMPVERQRINLMVILK